MIGAEPADCLRKLAADCPGILSLERLVYYWRLIASAFRTLLPVNVNHARGDYNRRSESDSVTNRISNR